MRIVIVYGLIIAGDILLVNRNNSYFTENFSTENRNCSIFKIGMPCATEQLLFQAGHLVTQAIIVPMGTNAIVFPIRFRGDRWLKHQVTMD